MSASCVSCNVALKAATRSCGRWRIKPTVSAKTAGPTSTRSILRKVGSSVANN
ncbi:Uncharacterised protein [Vibrio cholerae]|nr:Uncharacterised protein [Vibrio cholerae]